MLLADAAADTSSKFAFDATKDNWGMVVMAVIVLVSWFAFRKMIELSERRASKDKPPPPPKP